MSLASQQNSNPGKPILNKSQSDFPGHFPGELCWSIFQNPDWHFLSIFVICTILLGGSTLSLSLREISVTATRDEIVEIQDRYARLVLNVPVKKIKKAKESPPPSKIAREKEEEEEALPIPELLEAELDKAPPLKEEVEDIEIVLTGEIPEIEIKSLGQYEIEVADVQIEDEEGEKLALVVPADIPDPQAKSFGKYNTSKAEQTFTIEAPDIDVPSPKRYDVRKGGLKRGLPGPDIAPASQAVNRYDLAERRGASKIQAVGVQELQRPAVITASNVPDTRGDTSKRYVMARRGRSSNVPSKEKYAKSHKGIASEIPIIDRQVSSRRVANVAPDIQTRVSRKYNSGRKVEGASKTSRNPYPEQRTKKEDTRSGGDKSEYYLPETAALHHLATCVDPTEEIRLKRKVLAYIDGDILYCADSFAKYAFLNTEMLTTLDVRFVTYRDGVYNRCDALRMALKCLYNKKTKR